MVAMVPPLLALVSMWQRAMAKASAVCSFLTAAVPRWDWTASLIWDFAACPEPTTTLLTVVGWYSNMGSSRMPATRIGIGAGVGHHHGGFDDPGVGEEPFDRHTVDVELFDQLRYSVEDGLEAGGHRS